MNDFMPSGFPLTFHPSTFEDPIQKEQKKVRRAARLITVPLLFLVVVSRYWFVWLSGILSLFGISAQETYKFVFDAGTREAVQILISTILFLVPFSLSVKFSKNRLSDLIPTAKVSFREGIPLFLFGAGFSAFANIATALSGQVFQFFGVEYSVDFGESPRGIYGFFLAVLSTAVVPALVEEFATRGVVMGFLKPFGDGFSILVSAILFGALHGNFQQMPFAFLMGLVLGYIRVATGSIWVCVWLHGFNNLISTLFDYFFTRLTAWEKNAAFLVIWMVLLLVGILSSALLKRERPSNLLAQPENPEISEKQRYQWFFSSAWVVLFLVFVLWESIYYFF